MQTFLDAMPMTKEKMIAATATNTKPDRSTRHQLSDRVPANTHGEAGRKANTGSSPGRWLSSDRVDEHPQEFGETLPAGLGLKPVPSARLYATVSSLSSDISTASSHFVENSASSRFHNYTVERPKPSASAASPGPMPLASATTMSSFTGFIASDVCGASRLLCLLLLATDAALT